MTDLQDHAEPNIGPPNADSPNSGLVARPAGAVSTPTVTSGQSIGPYTLEERLGGGAMATVYRAIDRRTQQPVAVKVLLADADAVMRERFRREARTHSNLLHPHIVRILDIGHPDEADLTYMVMDLVDGPNLGEVIDETRRLPASAAARLLEPIARALDYSSRQGVVHRDVKPSNVLLRRVPPDIAGAVWLPELGIAVVPLLSDFGIARALDAPELTNAGRTIGTPTYMSPEQCADSHEIDGRSDLYSLGAVFYRCIVGRPPFGGSTTQILHAHVYEPLTIPEDVLAALPPLAVTILQRTLAKDPAQRYGRGNELAADLRTVAGLAPVVVEESGEATATMPALPAVRPAGGQAVLVPGLDAQSTAAATGVLLPGSADLVPAESVAPKVMTPLSVPAEPPRRRWVGALIGGVLALLVLAFGAGLVLNLLPDELIGRSPTPVSSGTPVAEASTPVVTAIDTTPGVIVTLLPSPAVTEVSSPVPVDTDPATLPPTVRPTASLPVPTPSGPIAGYWDDAKGAYDNHEWQTSLDYLTLVRRIDADYRREEIDTMLFDIQMGLAATAAASGNLDKAGEYLDAAVALRPDVAQVEAIQRALQALVAPNTLNKSMARWTLATELLKYGQTLLAVDNPCAAAEQFQAAGSVLPNADVTKLLTESEAACAEVKQAAAVREQLALLSGRLLYSTQEDNVYRIYRTNAAAEAPSTLVMEDGAQPARQRRGNVVAFHSTSETAPGIATFDLSSGSSPSVRTGRISTAPEDAHDAPPSWGPGDRQLAFGTTATGDRRSRVNLIDAQASETQTPLGLGRDPAWHPTEDRIIYNGLNDVGAEPGLWTMKSDGSARDRVTDNGNDIRPVWTPDGNDVVFMSSRDGNWEVYRVTVDSGVMLRLTNDPAQDGLPSVSPDGKWVAFASDRGKFWRVWVVSIDGGEAMPVLTMNGVLTNWLEHAIQWIP